MAGCCAPAAPARLVWQRCLAEEPPQATPALRPLGPRRRLQARPQSQGRQQRQHSPSLVPVWLVWDSAPARSSNLTARGVEKDESLLTDLCRRPLGRHGGFPQHVRHARATKGCANLLLDAWAHHTQIIEHILHHVSDGLRSTRFVALLRHAWRGVRGPAACDASPVTPSPPTPRSFASNKSLTNWCARILYWCVVKSPPSHHGGRGIFSRSQSRRRVRRSCARKERLSHRFFMPSASCNCRRAWMISFPLPFAGNP